MKQCAAHRASIHRATSVIIVDKVRKYIPVSKDATHVTSFNLGVQWDVSGWSEDLERSSAKVSQFHKGDWWCRLEGALSYYLLTDWC